MKSQWACRRLKVLKLIWRRQRILCQECKKSWTRMLSSKRTLSLLRRKNFLKNLSNFNQSSLKKKETLLIFNTIKNKSHQKQRIRIKNFLKSNKSSQLRSKNFQTKLMNFEKNYLRHQMNLWKLNLEMKEKLPLLIKRLSFKKRRFKNFLKH